MGDWQLIETAPRGMWILARSAAGGEALAVIADEEEGFWEDETGDYFADHRALSSGGGLKEWRPAPNGWSPMDLGSERIHEPVCEA